MTVSKTAAAAYADANALIPQTIRLTREQNLQVARKLYRFAMKITPDRVVTANGKSRRTYALGGGLRVAVDQSLHDLIHDMSHACHVRLHRFDPDAPEARPHSKAHARLERRMAKEAVARGWTTGSLDKPEPEAVAPVETTSSEPAFNPKRLELEQRVERIAVLRAAWERKLSRAANAIAKYDSETRRLTRRLEKLT